MSKTFKTMATSDEDSALVVDSMNLAFRWKHKGALQYADEFISTVESFKRSFKMRDIIILGDYGGSDYRKRVYPEYKANRADLKDKQTEEEAEYFKRFLEEYSKTIDQYIESNPLTFRFKGVEADDIAGYIVKNMAKFGYQTIRLLSSDRDWDLLINPNVSRFSYVNGKLVTLDNWSEHYAVSPEEYISLKCLTGDAGDNVPGITKVGPVTAKKLIDAYGSALDVADAIPIPGKYVYIKNTNDFGSENIMRNYQLMDILSFCEEAIGPENIAIINERFSNNV